MNKEINARENIHSGMQYREYVRDNADWIMRYNLTMAKSFVAKEAPAQERAGDGMPVMFEHPSGRKFYEQSDLKETFLKR